MIQGNARGIITSDCIMKEIINTPNSPEGEAFIASKT